MAAEATICAPFATLYHWAGDADEEDVICVSFGPLFLLSSSFIVVVVDDDDVDVDDDDDDDEAIDRIYALRIPLSRLFNWMRSFRILRPRGLLLPTSLLWPG